ncbi:MAG: chemotaxis-specific protein-glutamate methyltransferase CheB [Hyphomonadaceae bacterium]
MVRRDGAVGVLIVDDSAVVRGMIARGLRDDPDVQVLGAAGDGAAALRLLDELAPDVVLLDVEMPVLDGLQALPKLLARRPDLAVIMASSLTRRHAAMSLRALEMGAADYAPKPDAAGGGAAIAAFFDELKAKIKAHGRRKRAAATAPAPHAAFPRLRPQAVAIGCSTGGPAALLQIFRRAKGAVRTPVFVTQHMPATFTAMLAAQLGEAAGAEAVEAAHETPVRPGCLYVAPGGKHMIAARRGGGVVLLLSDGPPEHFCKPAVDPMLRSLAQAYGAGLLAAVLTGMGRDGADGCLAVAQAGGRFFVRDEATSAVWGMPGAAFRTGRAMGQLPLGAAADYLAAAMRGDA